MTLEEARNLVTASMRSDWNIITCWGANTGPSYLGRTYAGDAPLGWADDHGMRASYLPDVSLGLAWGLEALDDFREEWANRFADPHASAHFADILYNGMLVWRERYIVVDGGRAYLPIPRSADDLTVERWRYDFVRLLDNMEHRTSEYERYVQDAGLSRANA